MPDALSQRHGELVIASAFSAPANAEIPCEPFEKTAFLVKAIAAVVPVTLSRSGGAQPS
jgi:hypothetical protein